MDSSAYKTVITTREVKYNYYVSRGDPARPALLFLHGFPSTSFDWRHQAAFFRAKGFTVIVPDLLGYGGTDKPADVAMYKPSAMAVDVIDILDAEGVAPGSAVAVAHDRGSGLLARIANYYPERFAGFAFLVVGYAPPATEGSLADSFPKLKAAFGSELFGYQPFFAEEGVDKILEAHWESFLSLLYPSDPRLWADHLAPTGALKAWVLADKIAPLPRPSYATDEELDHATKHIRDAGLAGPLSWYKVQESGLTAEDNKQIPKERYTVQKPVFFGAAAKDYVCRPAFFNGITPKFCPNLTVREFDSDHWLQLARPDEVNRELLEWIEGI